MAVAKLVKKTVVEVRNHADLREFFRHVDHFAFGLIGGVRVKQKLTPAQLLRLPARIRALVQ